MSSHDHVDVGGGLTCTCVVTLCAERSIVRSEGAVTVESTVLFHTLSSIPAVCPVTVAVALTAWIHPWTHFCLLL